MSELPRLRKGNLRLRLPGTKRRERETLGFLRQPSVRWLSPPILARAAVEVAVSSAFGQFADKRESQTWEQWSHNLSWRRELWIDYLSDTGDSFEATYTMARLLAEPSLQVAGDHSLARGDVLLLGGDQVYPAASAEAYKDRFLGPFNAAFPSAEEGTEPTLFAIPGNHDWYDGLTSFLRIFGQRGSIGGWRKRQLRSYFSIKLPHRWWLWAIDIQLDTYLDKRQLDYFDAVARGMRRGDRVILLTAKPSWVKAKPRRLEPPSWEYLDFFEQQMIRDKGGDLALTLTGDIHHYARYEPVADTPSVTAPESASGGKETLAEPRSLPTRITAGGGGAYLSGTHTLPKKLELRTGVDGPIAEYSRCSRYPRAGCSWMLALFGVWRLPFKNPGFGGLMALVYLVVGWAAWASLLAAPEALPGGLTVGGYFELLARSVEVATIVAGVLLWVLLAIYADFSEVERALPRWLMKGLIGLLHAGLHLAAAAGAIYAVAQLPWEWASGGWFVPLSLAGTAGAGYLVGSWIFAAMLLLLHRWAPQHANEVFASQGIVNHKNFLRLHIKEDGALTVYPVAVDKVRRRWRYKGKSATSAWFSPVGGLPSARLIEPPIELPRQEPRPQHPISRASR